MATAATRKSRGSETQNAVAAWFRQYLFPYAESAGAGRGGKDVLNTPGLSIEVKARRGFNPLAWVRQAKEASSGPDLPLVVMRPDGLGLKSVDNWVVIMTLATATHLLKEAGYWQQEQPSTLLGPD